MRVAAAEYPQPGESVDIAGWKRTASLISAVLLGLIFLVSGGWKVLSPLRTGELLEQARVPGGWGALGAASLGSLEVLAAFLLFVPRFRRWGGLLGSALLIFFIAWVGFFYQSLAGQECSCFPLIKRTVGPGFFVGDGIMLLLGLAAAAWSPAVRRIRVPLLAFASILVIAAASLGIAKESNRGLQAPSPLVVDGRPQSISNGKVFLFFYDPQCMHCDAAARFMAKFDWGSTRVIGIPTTEPQFAASFLHDTGLRAGTSLETAKLRNVFKFVDPPYGVALDNGRQVAAYGQAQFNVPSPKADLEKLGFVK
jgi:uncharacterized membrane protein YphA (DoxX/SURF4 family)